jgi:tetratricopeptide (TPR) repeat protein
MSKAGSKYCKMPLAWLGTALCLGALLLIAAPNAQTSTKQPQGFAGAQSCRECHEKFYQLWAPSHHGLAMQPYSAKLARARLTPQKEAIAIGGKKYTVEIGGPQGWVKESGPQGEKKYQMLHALGGKNVFYFLTPLAKGRLQTLPLAYDLNEKKWFDTAASGIRHFPGRGPSDQALDWRDRRYTFNTSCHGCHVSQFSSNYDLANDTYHTTWTEPGINCETCHGPALEHVRVTQAAPKGTTPKDLKIIRGGGDFSTAQKNAVCASCHAKMSPLSTSFPPGERFYDHFDLITLEHSDYYPDGRDLGENYTYTSWRMSPCAQAGDLECLDCHTSSGRYRHLDDPNQSCLPCHQERVKNRLAHTHHKADSKGSLCISCHMPKTSFARMQRSDHSMLPPTPAATMKYKSPNACNNCHQDQDAAWSDKWVRKWRIRDYQKPVLHRAGLIQAARQGDWARLDEMLAYVEDPKRDEIVANSLIRLLRNCPEARKWPVIIKALKDPSPLIRASAAAALTPVPNTDALAGLFKALNDDSRLVRVRAVASLAGVPPKYIQQKPLKDLKKAEAEFKKSMLARPDEPGNHYNLGNFYLERRDLKKALASYESALKLQPDLLPALVNASMAYNLAGDNAKAEASLRRAQKLSPDDAAVNLNLGLLLAEQKKLVEAEAALRQALKANPKSAVAAYNLAVILAQDRLREAIGFARQARKLNPNQPRYAYTLAYYLWQAKDAGSAVNILRDLLVSHPDFGSSYFMLGDIYRSMGKPGEAARIYGEGVNNLALAPRERQALALRLGSVSGPQKSAAPQKRKP